MNQSSYETDLYGWSFDQAEFLRKRKFDMLDYENLIEEIESVGKSELNSLQSFLCICLLHMLKMKYQPEKHTRSWDLSIKNARHRVKRLMKKNPSFKSKIQEEVIEAYDSARLGAAWETGLEENIFPEVCPWTIEEVLGE
jgi:hypothetical protein